MLAEQQVSEAAPVKKTGLREVWHPNLCAKGFGRRGALGEWVKTWKNFSFPPGGSLANWQFPFHRGKATEKGARVFPGKMSTTLSFNAKNLWPFGLKSCNGCLSRKQASSNSKCKPPTWTKWELFSESEVWKEDSPHVFCLRDCVLVCFLTVSVSRDCVLAGFLKVSVNGGCFCVRYRSIYPSILGFTGVCNVAKCNVM